MHAAHCRLRSPASPQVCPQPARRLDARRRPLACLVSALFGQAASAEKSRATVRSGPAAHGRPQSARSRLLQTPVTTSQPTKPCPQRRTAVAGRTAKAAPRAAPLSLILLLQFGRGRALWRLPAAAGVTRLGRPWLAAARRRGERVPQRAGRHGACQRGCPVDDHVLRGAVAVELHPPARLSCTGLGQALRLPHVQAVIAGGAKDDSHHTHKPSKLKFVQHFGHKVHMQGCGGPTNAAFSGDLAVLNHVLIHKRGSHQPNTHALFIAGPVGHPASTWRAAAPCPFAPAGVPYKRCSSFQAVRAAIQAVSSQGSTRRTLCWPRALHA